VKFKVEAKTNKSTKLKNTSKKRNVKHKTPNKQRVIINKLAICTLRHILNKEAVISSISLISKTSSLHQTVPVVNKITNQEINK
jgi:hypothetical protein